MISNTASGRSQAQHEAWCAGTRVSRRDESHAYMYSESLWCTALRASRSSDLRGSHCWTCNQEN